MDESGGSAVDVVAVWRRFGLALDAFSVEKIVAKIVGLKFVVFSLWSQIKCEK